MRVSKLVKRVRWLTRGHAVPRQGPNRGPALVPFLQSSLRSTLGTGHRIRKLDHAKGVVGTGWMGFSRGPYYGRFTCTGWANVARTAVHETCHHARDQHAGAITVNFTITAAPGG